MGENGMDRWEIIDNWEKWITGVEKDEWKKIDKWEKMDKWEKVYKWEKMDKWEEMDKWKKLINKWEELLTKHNKKHGNCWRNVDLFLDNVGK